MLLHGHKVTNKALALEMLEASMCDAGAGDEVTFDRANYRGNAHGTTDASITRPGERRFILKNAIRER